jgi:kynurenine formamidase
MSKNKKHILLSYPITENTPLYPGTPKIRFKKLKDVERKDSCSLFLLVLANHAGTHVDAPRHFFANGKAASRYTLEELTFTSPVILSCPKLPGEPLEPSDIDTEDLNSCDLLLLRTGASLLREKKPHIYSNDNPFISPEAARLIRTHYPNIRAIGIDTVSVSSRKYRSLGRQTHRILLGRGRFAGKPVLIIEDMRLPPSLRVLKEVIVIPLFGKGIDSSPCTVIGTL